MPPTVLCEREKFAFMAPPAHTDPEKWSALRNPAEKHLSPEAIEDAGLLNVAAVNQLFALHEARDTSASTQVQLDAIINHMLGCRYCMTSLLGQISRQWLHDGPKSWAGGRQIR